jgi:hypothetical protein
LSFFFRGVAGQKAYNNALAGLESGSNLRLQNGQNVTRASLSNGIKMASFSLIVGWKMPLICG